MTFLSRIWGLEELLEKGKITEKQVEKIIMEFIIRAAKLEEEKGIRVYDVVSEENLNEYLDNAEECDG